MIKVLIVDDQELFRESLKVVLGSANEIEIIGSASGVSEALTILCAEKADVVLMDIRMPGKDGVEGTKIIKDLYPEIKVIVLTTFDDDEYVFGALKYGASGYLLKGSSISELSDAIQIAYSGGAMINPDIASKMIRQFSAMAANAEKIEARRKLLDGFSKSEQSIVNAVGRGLSNKEIAAELFLSEGTVRNYISNILMKAGLRDRTQLAIWAVQAGLAG